MPGGRVGVLDGRHDHPHPRSRAGRGRAPRPGRLEVAARPAGRLRELLEVGDDAAEAVHEEDCCEDVGHGRHHLVQKLYDL